MTTISDVQLLKTAIKQETITVRKWKHSYKDYQRRLSAYWLLPQNERWKLQKEKKAPWDLPSGVAGCIGGRARLLCTIRSHQRGRIHAMSLHKTLDDQAKWLADYLDAGMRNPLSDDEVEVLSRVLALVRQHCRHKSTPDATCCYCGKSANPATSCPAPIDPVPTP